MEDVWAASAELFKIKLMGSVEDVVAVPGSISGQVAMIQLSNNFCQQEDSFYVCRLVSRP